MLLVHVSVDACDNMYYAIKEAHSGRCTSFVHTGVGISPGSEADTLLKAPLKHKYSGKYDGTIEQLQASLHRNTSTAVSNDSILKNSGITNLQCGVGAGVSLAVAACAFANGVQMGNMFNQFSADGVVTSSEWLQIAREGVQGVLNPVGDLKSDFMAGAAQSAYETVAGGDGEGVVEAVIEAVLSGLAAIIGL